MNHKKTTFLASLGAGLEYYDFAIYGIMASYLSALFFPDTHRELSLLKTFGIFAVGYFARPLGGILFGSLGDFLGRKSSFIFVMLLMALATLGIGFLPTGDKGAFLLVFLRILQGLSFGAEMPGAITVVCENIKTEKKGLFLSFVVSSVSLGAMLASLVLYLLTHFFSREEILLGAWRYPFWIGGLLGIVCLILRQNLNETPKFLEEQVKQKHESLKAPLIQLLTHHKKALLKGLISNLFMSSLIIFAIFQATYLTEYFGYKPADIYLGNLISLIWSVLTLPFFGYLVDKFGKKNSMKALIFTFLCLSFYMFKILNIGSFYALILFMLIYQCFISLASPIYFSFVTDLFPVAVRYTGIGTCYNISYSLMGCLPLFLTYLIKETNILYIPFVMLAIFGLLGLLIILRDSQKQ
ncbi:MAG: MFS transporter [Rhabdochlamydiaceae bacterium]